MKRYLFAALSLVPVAAGAESWSQSIEPEAITSKHQISSVTGGETGILFVPMKGLLRSFPLGFSFCASSVDDSTTFAIQNVFGFQTYIKNNCLVFNSVILQYNSALQIDTGSASYEIDLPVAAGLNYADRSFRALRTDAEIFATLTYEHASVASSEEAIVCANRPVNKVLVETRPLGSNDALKIVPTSSAGRFCSYVYNLPWKKGSWETFVRFDEMAPIRYVETIK